MKSKKHFMSKSTKPHGHANASVFHYFTLAAISNGDGTVTVSFNQVEPVPDGQVIKTVGLLRRDGAVDPDAGDPITAVNVIEIAGFSAANTTDRELAPQSVIDVPSVAGTYTYNLEGTYGVYGDNSSQNLLGSNWVAVTV